VGEERIKVEGMSCQHCVSAVKKALESLQGVEAVQVDLEKGEVRFVRSEGVSLDQVRAAVEGAGYRMAG
jgi:copper chaperone